MSNSPQESDKSIEASAASKEPGNCASSSGTCAPCGGAAGRLRKLFLLIVLLAVFVGEVTEIRARGAAQAAFDRLNLALGKEKELQHLTRVEVHQVIGRDPDEFDRSHGKEVYRWKDGLRPHAVYVRYVWVDQKIYASDIAFDDDPGY